MNYYSTYYYYLLFNAGINIRTFMHLYILIFRQ